MKSSGIQTVCILQTILRVSERLVLGYDNLMKEVEAVMGGVLLKTKADEILEQGIELGEAIGRAKAASLFGFLLANGRYDDAIKASADPNYLHQLLEEFRGDIPSAT